MRSCVRLCACLLLLAACGERPPAADTPGAEPVVSPEVFAGLPVLPGARLAGGSANAAEAVVEVPVPADSAARFYRQVLAARHWDIRGDVTDAGGQVTLHARSDEGRPIWIIIRPAGPGRTEISVIATAVDSATGH